MDKGLAMTIAFLFLSFLTVCILVFLSRWIFRINDIVNRLDSIINALKVAHGTEEIKK